MTLSVFRQSHVNSGDAPHEQAVRDHYTQPGLRDAILRGLAALDIATAVTRADDLGAVDEFHLGGRDATLALASQLALSSDMRLLDVGCGLGGAARSLASRYRCLVDGIDLVPECVSVGSMVNELTGLSSLVQLQVGRATAIPFSHRPFDRCLVLHVGMNVPDKRRMMEEIHRVLKPGGLLGLYDVMRVPRGRWWFRSLGQVSRTLPLSPARRRTAPPWIAPDSISSPYATVSDSACDSFA